ncbi:MAG: YjbQ family protein [Candidatus Omnitrophica bacterium]|nr:YjbQ family protein [Candidatus Omnitrophota bacterium]
MKAYTEYLWFNTKGKTEFLNITSQVNQCLQKSGIKEGFCLVNAMHITASVFTYD